MYPYLNLNFYRTFVLVSVFIAFISGCTNLPSKKLSSQPETLAEPKSIEQKIDVNHTKPQEQTAPLDQATFSTDTLYALMVAEIAGHRGRVDIALDQYSNQARATRDPKIIARANRIARYMRAPKVALETSLLWIEVEPTSIEARQVAVQQLIMFGRHQEALQQIDALLQLSAEINLEGLVKSASLLEPEPLEQLTKSINALAEKYKPNSKLSLAEGFLLEINQQHDAALESFRSILKHDEDYIPAYIAQARLLTKMERKDEAIRLISKAIKKHPKQVRLRLFYAQQLIADKQLDKAEKQLKTIKELAPDDDKLLFSMGMIYLENDLGQAARPYFENILKNGELNDDAHFYLGAIDEDAGKLESALDHLRKVKPSRQFVNARIQIASILEKQGKTDEALASLVADREGLPQFAAIFYLAQSEILADRKRYKESFQVLEQALESHINNEQLLYSHAMVAEKLDLIDIMEKDLLSIIEKNPKNVSALNALGYTLADRGKRLDEAFTYISRAFTLAPEDPAVIDSMGWVHFRMNQPEKALLHLRKAHRLMPDHEISAHLGEVLWVLNQKQEAERIWRESLEKNPESEVLREVIQRLTP